MEDSDLYKKALINSNFSYGIGALAYFRRVVENKVNDLLDLIADAARNAQFELEQVARIEEIKSNRHRIHESSSHRRFCQSTFAQAVITPWTSSTPSQAPDFTGSPTRNV